MDTNSCGAHYGGGESPAEPQITLPFPRGIQFVEFFGLPGAGKTTIAKCLEQKLSDLGVPAASAASIQADTTFLKRQLARASAVISQVTNIKYISVCCRIAMWVNKGKQESLLDQVRLTWNLWAITAYVLRQRFTPRQIIVLDQGLLQGIWSAGLTTRDKNVNASWLDVLSVIGIYDFAFVVLDADVDLARARLFERNDNASRMQRQKHKFGDCHWLAGVRIGAEMEAALRHPGRAGRVLTINVSPTARAIDIADMVLSTLRSLDNQTSPLNGRHQSGRTAPGGCGNQ